MECLRESLSKPSEDHLSEVDRDPDIETMLILAYHRVNPEVRDGLSVAPATLREHLKRLIARGWRNVVLEEEIGAAPIDLPDKTFAITFDDGYQDNYVHAVPVLEELNLRATVYLVSSMIDSDRPFPWLKLPSPDSFDELDLHMTTAQLESARGVFTYGSHTLSHPMLSDLDRPAATEEIATSKRDLEQRLGDEITTFCYPAGNFNAETIDLVRQAGYRAAVVTPNRYIPETMHTLHRVGIYSHITPRLFAAKTSRLFDRAQRSRAFWDLRSRLGRRST
jgi:peptidoglycan/xylan/chitin deacetylase (PgdA/CDA1 family)